MEIEAERGQMIMEKKENRRMQQRIPRSKGRGKGKGIPGMEIIEAYRPMTTALGPRMTVSLIAISHLLNVLPHHTSPTSVFLIRLPNPAGYPSYTRVLSRDGADAR